MAETVELFPQGSLVGVGIITKYTPPVLTEAYGKAEFQCRVDSFQGVVGPPATTLDVQVEISNDGINWYRPPVPGNFPSPLMTFVGGAMVLDSFLSVTELGRFARLFIQVTDPPGVANVGATLRVLANLKKAY